MKKWNQKGFTLAELLIVVAIIAVLVAISIPIFNQQLEKSRENTDIANLRAAKAAAVSAYLTEDTNLDLDDFDKSNGSGGTYSHVILIYDASAGVLKKTITNVSAYGKGTATKGNCENYEMWTKATPVLDADDNPTGDYTYELKPYTQDTVAKGKLIVVDIDSGGNLQMGWLSPSVAAEAAKMADANLGAQTAAFAFD